MEYGVVTRPRRAGDRPGRTPLVRAAGPEIRADPAPVDIVAGIEPDAGSGPGRRDGARRGLITVIGLAAAPRPLAAVPPADLDPPTDPAHGRGSPVGR